MQLRKVVLVGSDKRGSSGRAGIDNLLSHAADKSGREPARQARSQSQHANMAAAPPLLQPSDRFALRWNDFPDNVTAIFRWETLCVCASVTLVYRQLRRDAQLADVTLMCAGGRQVRARGTL